MESQEKLFYKTSYANLKNIENKLLAEIDAMLKNVNEQSETALIEHITSRIKTPESAINKLQKVGCDPTEENAIGLLSDIVGVRLITHFIGDIYMIRNILVNSGEFRIVREKDYIRNAKKTGYRSYHIVVEIEVDGFKINAEIQLRTIAMDCWASLEHQIRYKKGIKNTDLIDFELKKCSDDLMSADIAMEQIWSMVRSETESAYASEGFFEDAMKAAQEAHIMIPIAPIQAG